jgi:SsrA-binding protein
MKILSQNKKASYEYFLEQEYEAGLVLTGDEIKSLRQGGANIRDAHVNQDKDGELYIYNFHISPYKLATRFNYSNPLRKKKLLLRRSEIKKILAHIKLRGFTCIPLMLYINKRNYAKLKIATAKGKKLYDKRESIKRKNLRREELQAIKQKVTK